MLQPTVIFYKYVIYSLWISKIKYFSYSAGIIASLSEIFLRNIKICRNFKYFSFLLYGKTILIFFNDRLMDNLATKEKLFWFNHLYLLLSVMISGTIYIVKPKLYKMAAASIAYFLIFTLLAMVYNVHFIYNLSIFIFLMFLYRIKQFTKYLINFICLFIVQLQTLSIVINNHVDLISLFISSIYLLLLIITDHIKHINICK